MPQKIILIDYENIQPDQELDQKSEILIKNNNVGIFLFAGPQLEKRALKIKDKLQGMNKRFQNIIIKKSGPNAADLHIAYYIGALAEKSPGTRFYILSKDKDFSSLITHLEEKKIKISREKDINKIMAVKKKPKPQKKISDVTENLRKIGASRPKTLKALASTINAWFQKQLSAEEIESLIEDLKREKCIVITDSKISYTLPS